MAAIKLAIIGSIALAMGLVALLVYGVSTLPGGA
jgi:hypothetical protein